MERMGGWGGRGGEAGDERGCGEEGIFPDEAAVWCRLAGRGSGDGSGNPNDAEKFKKVPVWVFHGAKDDVVKPENSQRMVDALKEARGEVKYTEYPDGDHGISGRVYGDKEMHEWLFGQRK
jgi:predicted peptidase